MKRNSRIFDPSLMLYVFVFLFSGCAQNEYPIRIPSDVTIDRKEIDQREIFESREVFVVGRGDVRILEEWVRTLGLVRLDGSGNPPMARIAFFDENREWWNPSQSTETEFYGEERGGDVWIQIKLEGERFFMWLVGKW